MKLSGIDVEPCSCGAYPRADVTLGPTGKAVVKCPKCGEAGPEIKVGAIVNTAARQAITAWNHKRRQQQ